MESPPLLCVLSSSAAPKELSWEYLKVLRRPLHAYLLKSKDIASSSQKSLDSFGRLDVAFAKAAISRPDRPRQIERYLNGFGSVETRTVDQAETRSLIEILLKACGSAAVVPARPGVEIYDVGARKLGNSPLFYMPQFTTSYRPLNRTEIC